MACPAADGNPVAFRGMPRALPLAPPRKHLIMCIGDYFSAYCGRVSQVKHADKGAVFRATELYRARHFLQCTAQGTSFFLLTLSPLLLTGGRVHIRSILLLASVAVSRVVLQLLVLAADAGTRSMNTRSPYKNVKWAFSIPLTIAVASLCLSCTRRPPSLLPPSLLPPPRPLSPARNQAGG